MTSFDKTARPAADSVGERIPLAYLKFFDDAAVFPPGSATTEEAVHGWFARSRTPLAEVTGPLVLRPGDLVEARELVRGMETRRALPVVVVTTVDELGEDLFARDHLAPEIVVVGLELRTKPSTVSWDVSVRRVLEMSEALPIAVELDEEQVADGCLESLEGAGIVVKFRAGGLEPERFPTPESLGFMLHEAVRRSVPLKLTAGLHEAVRHTNPATGLTHHGFLNIAQAVERARRGEELNAVVAALHETSDDVLTSWARSSDGAWREAFRSFGTCSVREPLESLARLGLFPVSLLHDAPIPR